MKAGRELDAEVAEKVLRLEIVRNKKGPWSIGEADWYDEYGEMKIFNPLPQYSSDITAAMEVFEYMRNSRDWCCLTINSDYNYCWTVSLTPGFGKRILDHKPIISETSEELPLAICKAALKSSETL